MSVFDGDRELTKDDIEQLIFDESHRRETGKSTKQPLRSKQPKEVTAQELASILGVGTLTAEEARKFSHTNLGKSIRQEYQDIRTDPARQAKQYDEMVRTYEQYLDKTNNPIEEFLPMKDMYAAATLDDGRDVVIFDPSAPHAAIMAHELGHINMNHSTNPVLDPMAYLQTSGLGRWSGTHAAAIGGVGASLGAAAGAIGSRMRGKGNHLMNQAMGTAIGGGLGVVGGSGQAAYEMLGASGRSFDYLPEDIDKVDAAGDLTKAGLTYVMGGPVDAATTAAGVGAAALIAAHPGTRRYMRERGGDLINAIRGERMHRQS